ncbi:hypothetical protein GGI12_004218 [Dipsacomyces acuminosporus]|nr:hypothetical protein GGI12_004218 [Dipsacomyces acuminosporus]
MIVVVFAILGITAIPVILAWIHKDYRPIRAKNLVNITLLLVAGVGWSVGGMVINSLVPIAGVWSNCKAWVLWVRVSFTCMFFFLLLFRTYTLHRIFILNRPCRSIGFYLPAILYTAFQLIFNIASQVISDDRTFKYLPNLEMCTVGRAYHYLCFFVVVVLWTIHTVYMVLIRNIRSSFNEFRESLFIFFGASAMVVELAVLHLGIKGFALHLYARIISAICDTLCIAVPVWILLSYPLYQCLFNHDQYLLEWVQKLKADGMGKLYDRQEGISGSSTSAYSRMENGLKSEKNLALNSAGEAAGNGTTMAGSLHSCGGSAQQEEVRIRFDRGPSEPRYAHQPSSSEVSVSESVSYSSLSAKPLN